ncbi:MAG: LytTR family DNA-binding domain-containing protein [Bacteroidota bacterium]
MIRTKNIRALIVEDEAESRETLYNMLERYCEGVEVVGQSESVSSAVEAIRHHQPDIVFLDIEMPQETGFKLFDYFPQPDFDIIFTTAYDQYAVRAFKFSAVDYLLKPIDLQELRKAVGKASTKRKWRQGFLHYQLLRKNLNNDFKKIVLPTAEGVLFIELSDIIRCEAQGNYTAFYLVDGQKIIVSKTLKIYAELLSGLNFFRINRSDLINLSKVRKYGRQKAPTVTLIDGTTLIMSENRRKDFLEQI